jgi:hypothetical protein
MILAIILLIVIIIAIAGFSASGKNDEKNMVTKSKLIRTIYLYVAALVSLIFVAVGTGRILDTVLKAYVFPKAEKGGYSRCNQQPPIYALDKGNISVATEEQKVILDNMIKDYEQWKRNNSEVECYSQERQSNMVDSLVILIIALPICLFHWRLIKKDKNEKD